MKRYLTKIPRFRFFSSSSSSSSNSSSKTQVKQAPNHASIWSARQQTRASALHGPRFETVALDKQPAPAAAIELIAAVPVKQVKERIVACDGGGGALGHPKIYINLVKQKSNKGRGLMLSLSLAHVGSRKGYFMHILWFKVSTRRSTLSAL